MNELQGLVVPIEARIDKLEKGLARANRAQRRASGQMERRARQSANRINATYADMGKSISASFTRMAAPLLAGVASVQTVRSIAATTRAIASLGDEAKRAGVGLEAFQQWRFVAEQNRIGVDQLVDGLKELNLRGDEFAVTGGGPAADAFKRLGFEASELAERLEDPSELMLEIIGRMEGMDTAAQIRTADEVFGGTAGERFVELLGQGEDGIRRTMDRAHELGAVMDSDMIAKAQDLDRRFTEVNTRMRTLWQTGVVGAAEFFGVLEQGDAEVLEELLQRLERLGVAGKGFSPDTSDIEILQGELIGLEAIYGTLTGEAGIFERELRDIAATLAETGNLGAAQAFTDIADEVAKSTRAFNDNEISAEELYDDLDLLMGQAAQTAGSLGEVAGVSFDGLIERLAALSSTMQTVAEWAREAANAVLSVPSASTSPAVEDGHFFDDPANEALVNPPTDNAPTSSPRPRPAPNDPDFGVPPVTITPSTSSGGGGGGGGSVRQSEWERELENIAEETAALRLEAEALLNVTDAQIRRGDATELARTKAELLNAVIQSGIQDTPELRSQIDELASEYLAASNSADLAADRIREVQNASQNGANSIANVFMGMATGALSAKEAVGQLILQIIKLSLQKRLLETAQNTGGWLGNIIGIIGGGFASGGYTGDGPKLKPAGIVHSGEYVMSKAATSAIGVGNLERLHRSALKGYSDGGLVGAAKNMGSTSGDSLRRSGDASDTITINAPISIEGNAGTPEQNEDLAKRMSRELESSMKGMVVDTIRQQMRNGNMLSRRN